MNGKTLYGPNPITILKQNGTHVEFKVTNTFGWKSTSIFTQYHAGSFGDTECLEEENVGSYEEVETYTALCMHNVNISIVHLWIADGNYTFLDEDLDDAEVPECCHGPEYSQSPTVEYTFKIPCDDPCPPEEGGYPAARRLVAEEDIAASAQEFESQTATAASSKDNEPSTDAKDGHFCVSEDYPCSEEDPSKVYVCHYSARDGYKTFCVPEPDSDVLAFYPKDYCGPCVGGYGRQANH
jgi:hypothetical protein